MSVAEIEIEYRKMPLAWVSACETGSSPAGLDVSIESIRRGD